MLVIVVGLGLYFYVDWGLLLGALFVRLVVVLPINTFNLKEIAGFSFQ